LPTPQAAPQAPQLAASRWTSTQVPPQSVNPVGQRQLVASHWYPGGQT
jgi:hypothetical protein